MRGMGLDSENWLPEGRNDGGTHIIINRGGAAHKIHYTKADQLINKGGWTLDLFLDMTYQYCIKGGTHI
jgi:hypothetical protein